MIQLQRTERCCQEIFPPELNKLLPGSLKQQGLQKTGISTTALCVNGVPVPAEAGRT